MHTSNTQTLLRATSNVCSSRPTAIALPHPFSFPPTTGAVACICACAREKACWSTGRRRLAGGCPRRVMLHSRFSHIQNATVRSEGLKSQNHCLVSLDPGCPSTVQRSEGLGPFFQIKLLRSGRRALLRMALRREPRHGGLDRDVYHYSF